jgi:hypothetical protein
MSWKTHEWTSSGGLSVRHMPGLEMPCHVQPGVVVTRSLWPAGAYP